MTRSLLKIHLTRAIETLLRLDKNIRAVALFNSAIYAPKLTCDLDLSAVTEEKRSQGLYLDAVGNLPAVKVGIIVQRKSEKLMGPTARVMAFGMPMWRVVNAAHKGLDRMIVTTLDEARQQMFDTDDYECENQTITPWSDKALSLSFQCAL